jgi:hypothetical protein
VDLRWDQIDFAHGRLQFADQAGHPGDHPPGDELRDLRKLQREQEPRSMFVFTSNGDRCSRLRASAVGWSAPAPRPSRASCPPHMLRHACGRPANKGRIPGSTCLPPAEYPAYGSIHRLSPTRFKDF